MPSRSSSSPTFSWLVPAFRPTRAEVRAYAKAIQASDEGVRKSSAGILRQAELQLWVWRTENRLSPPKRPRGLRQIGKTADSTQSIVGAMPAF